MTVLERAELEQSPLADLHTIASELGIEGYRRLRREELIGAIVEGQGGAPAGSEESAAEAPAPRRRSRPRRRARTEEADEAPPAAAEEESESEPEPEAERRSGILDVLPNGSGFLRSDELSQGKDDVYVAPAQIRRCELRSGDEVAGPTRGPRRSERHPSLVHVESVNGADPEPPAERPRVGDLTPVFPSERLTAPDGLDSVPFGKGSRVAIGGPPGAGASAVLRQIAAVLGAQHGDIELTVVLAGVRPEEVTDWRRELSARVVGGSFEAAAERQAEAASMAVERAKRAAERGGDAVVLIDSLDALPAQAARRVFGAARNTEEAGSVTVFATTGLAAEPQRIATTRIVLEAALPDAQPKLAEETSGTLRSELLGASG